MIRACVIGWPVAHSRSPLIHGHWLKTYGIAGTYTKIPVRLEDVATFLRSMADQGLAGCNVTVPHKEAAFAAAAKTSAAARAMGAANTLWFEDGRLVADNTDSVAFMEHLRVSAPRLNLRNSLVALLGAGGAARALVFAFLEAGAAEVRIFNRTRERADAVARHFGAAVKPCDWSQRVDASREAALLVNATSLGMTGAGDLDMDVSRLDASCVVSDIVYVPLQTPLLAAAAARGLTAVDGLGMFLHQAVPGFERWFGVRPAVTDELRALVVADIEGR
jgi:shikimate dehydrogenase